MREYQKKELICVECGGKMIGNSCRQFCDECRKKRKNERDKETRQRHAQQYEIRGKEKSQRCHIQGIKSASRLNQNNLTTIYKKDDAPKALFKFAIPFASGVSKNYYLGLRRYKPGEKAFYKRGEALKHEQLIKMLSAKAKGIFKQNKIWIDIYVEKPNNRSDAVNVVDLVCDGIKKGIEIDDRWFSLGLVDWKVVKGREPQVFVKIYQEDNWEARLCALCGRILPNKCFGGKKNNNCKECTHKGYVFSDDDLEEMIKATQIPEEFYADGSLSEVEEREFQKCIVHQKIYGNAES